MSASLVCHVLIGPPGSGKSTFANLLTQLDPTALIVSTDQIRRKLFGDETLQGDWLLIEAKVLAQIREAIQSGHSVIYDATNAKKEWRLSLLKQIADENGQWIGWHLETPLELCKAWNKKRTRQVPERVIEELFRALQENPPHESEGFIAINSVNLMAENFDIQVIKNMIKMHY